MGLFNCFFLLFFQCSLATMTRQSAAAAVAGVGYYEKIRKLTTIMIVIVVGQNDAV